MLNLAFKIADDNGLLLLDLKDLRAMLHSDNDGIVEGMEIEMEGNGMEWNI